MTENDLLCQKMSVGEKPNETWVWNYCWIGSYNNTEFCIANYKPDNNVGCPEKVKIQTDPDNNTSCKHWLDRATSWIDDLKPPDPSEWS